MNCAISAIVGNNTTYIGEAAFYECVNLTGKLIIPESITDISSSAFSGCSSITSVEIHNGVTSIGESAFYGCSGIKTVINFSNLTFSKGSSNNGYVAYYADNVHNAPNGSIIDDFIFGEVECVNTLIKYIGDSTEILLPEKYKDGAYAIGSSAFKNCSNITSILLPDCITHIGERAFENCSKLTSIEIPNSVTSIGSSAFSSCTSLTDIVIPNGVTRIEDFTFSNCKSLQNVTIPSSVTGIGIRAFQNCNNLISIRSFIPAENLFELDTRYGWSAVFDGANTNTCILYVPHNALDTYKTTNGWSDFKNIEELKYRITYIVNGEVYTTRDLAYGAEIPVDIKEGYTFVCNDLPSSMPAEDITISGSFTVNNYVVTYIVDGEVYKTVNVVYGTEIVLIDEPTKEGHTFSGWSEAPSTMPAEDITISGSFTVNNYTVTYIVDGEVYKTVGVAYGTDVVLIDEPTKEGHTFSGWSEVPSTMPAEDIIVSGSFTVNSYTVTFTVDGEVYKTMSVEYGKEIPTVETPTKEGRKFSGWSEIPSTMPAKNVNVEGGFCYTIIYMLDGKYYNSSEIYYGSVIKAPAEPPHKEGHTFVEWGNLPATMPARDMTIHAVYSVNKYQLIFIIDGEVYETLYVEYGSKIEYPQKEGYIIIWETENLPETMPAENLIIIGRSTLDTAIKAINEESSDYTIYTLDGHRVMDIENLRSGFYIINGKKVFVK